MPHDRRVACGVCGQVAVMRDWASRPAGWFILLPPGLTIISEVLELLACSEQCLIRWLQVRWASRTVGVAGAAS